MVAQVFQDGYTRADYWLKRERGNENNKTLIYKA